MSTLNFKSDTKFVARVSPLILKCSVCSHLAHVEWKSVWCRLMRLYLFRTARTSIGCPDCTEAGDWWSGILHFFATSETCVRQNGGTNRPFAASTRDLSTYRKLQAGASSSVTRRHAVLGRERGLYTLLFNMSCRGHSRTLEATVLPK